MGPLYFVLEANLVILKFTHNSPTVIDLLLGSASIATAMKIAIDAVLQIPQRIKAKKLENEKKELELEKDRWEFQTKRIDYAIETAIRMVDILRPGIDPTTKGNLLQPLIPTLSEPNGIDKLDTVLLLPDEKNKVTVIEENKKEHPQ